MSTRVVLTYRDLGSLPEDGCRYELYEGELAVTAAPNTAHQRAVARLLVLLTAHVGSRRLGEVFVSPVDCILTDTTVVEPNLVYLDASRSGLVSHRGIEGPPTLVVEVVSPSTAQRDRGAKLALTGSMLALVGCLEGERPGSLPPFDDLTLTAGHLCS